MDTEENVASIITVVLGATANHKSKKTKIHI